MHRRQSMHPLPSAPSGAALQTHPSGPPVARTLLHVALIALQGCAQACVACAEACVTDPNAKELSRCVRLCLDCAAICDAAIKLLSRQTAFTRQPTQALIETCVLACQLCADQCSEHAATRAHCGQCADACQRSAQACARLVAAPQAA